MDKIIKLENIDFETNLKYEDIVDIAEVYVKRQREAYEINYEDIVYNTKSRITNEPVWYIDVIDKETKKNWPDAYDTLVISDFEKRVVYVFNEHGRIIKKY